MIVQRTENLSLRAKIEVGDILYLVVLYLVKSTTKLRKLKGIHEFDPIVWDFF